MSGIRSLFRRGKHVMSHIRRFAPPRLIVSAGMPRSGSTWLYNAARLLLADAVPPHELAAGWVDDWPMLPRRKWLLVKVHEYEPRLARRAHGILYSFRDVRDALASARRRFGIDPTLALVERWLEADRRWRARAAFTLRYETMLADPAGAIGALAVTLKLPCPDAAALAGRLQSLVDASTHLGGERHDPETLLHPGHRTDGRHGTWAEWLSPGLIQAVEERHGGWLRANGYPLSRRTASRAVS